jgi:rhodanese-related sulfurtransferase
MILNPLEKSVHELVDFRAAGERLLLLDVRESVEYAWCHLPDSQLIPLDDLPARFEELTRDTLILVLCHTGVRSLAAASFLRAQGFTRAFSLAGGIHHWSLVIDSSVPTY